MTMATDTITVVEGYDAMRIFLDTVWRRHDKPVEEITFVLGGLKWADGSPVDPTMWSRLACSRSNYSVSRTQ